MSAYTHTPQAQVALPSSGPSVAPQVNIVEDLVAALRTKNSINPELKIQ